MTIYNNDDLAVSDPTVDNLSPAGMCLKHYMLAVSIPKTVIKAIDRRRRAFFWTGEDVRHGSKCLVAWDNVRASKMDGGLGVKDLELQNRCLLMKFINKLFSGESVAWKDWLLRDAASFDTPSSGSHSYLWKIINDELNTYCSITTIAPPPPSGSTPGFMLVLFAPPMMHTFPTLPGLTCPCKMFSRMGLNCAYILGSPMLLALSWTALSLVYRNSLSAMILIRGF